jgi:hypothetical protein
MTVTPDDSARLQSLGIALLSNLAFLLTLTFLHGNDFTIYPADAPTQSNPSISGISTMVFSIAIRTTLFV